MDKKKYRSEIVVTPSMSAIMAIEEAPNVYGTPSLVAFIEKSCHEAINELISGDRTSVGLDFDLRHFSPTPIGMKVVCEVEVQEIDGIFITFNVVVLDESGPVCECIHKRAIVDKSRIESKAKRKGGEA